MSDSNDVLDLCRVCMLQYKGMNSVFDTMEGGLICDKIAFCTGLQITTYDILPTQICNKCLEDLSVAHKFKMACLSADESFRRTITHTVKVEAIRSRSPIINDDDFFDEIDNCHRSHHKNGNNKKNLDKNLIKLLKGNGVVVKTKGCLSKLDEKLIGTKIIDSVPISMSREQLINGETDCYKENEDSTSFPEETLRMKEKENVKKDKNATEFKMKRRLGHPLEGVKIQNQYDITNVTCTQCQIQFKTKQECDKHRREQHKETFICEVCGLTIHRRNSYYAHMSTHKPLKHKCHECGYQTWQKSVLTIHMQTHSGVRAHKCHLCPKDYKLMTTLRDHIRRDHERVKPHACTLCDKKYFDKVSLHTHMDSHNNIKRFECELCFSRFTHRKHWKRHLQNQHNMTVPRAKPGRKDKYSTVVETLINNINIDKNDIDLQLNGICMETGSVGTEPK